MARERLFPWFGTLLILAWTFLGWLTLFHGGGASSRRERPTPGWSELKPTTSEAYTTLLYGDAFLLGVRVLGQSIRETGTKRDLVCIVTSASDESVRTLQEDGWKVVVAETIQNPSVGPGKTFPRRFWGVYTKLSIFRLPYKKVLYLDADTIVVKNIDDAFHCGGSSGLCVNLKHSEHVNTGVMVVSPSKELFDKMMEHIATTPSYTGGDQGFIDSFFADFSSAPVFVPDHVVKDPQENARRPRVGKGISGPMGVEMLRLPTEYNADVGLYLFNSERWSIPESKLRVVHFTLGPIKPWNWWSSWLLKPGVQWQALRNNLRNADGPGNSVGHRVLLFVGPLLFHCLYVAGSSLFTMKRSAHIEKLHVQAVSPYLKFCCRNMGPISIAFGFASLAFAFVLPPILFIPTQARPVEGWLLAYWWGFYLFGLIYYMFLEQCFYWGKAAGMESKMRSFTGNYAVPEQEPMELFRAAQGRRSLLKDTTPLFFSCALFTIFVPWFPVVFYNLVLRLVLLGVALSMASAWLSYSFWHVATLWFRNGYSFNRSEAWKNDTDNMFQMQCAI